MTDRFTTRPATGIDSITASSSFLLDQRGAQLDIIRFAEAATTDGEATAVEWYGKLVGVFGYGPCGDPAQIIGLDISKSDPELSFFALAPEVSNSAEKIFSLAMQAITKRYGADRPIVVRVPKDAPAYKAMVERLGFSLRQSVGTTYLYTWNWGD